MTEETAGARRSGARALAAPLGAALAAGTAVALVGAVDPNEPGHYPSCPFLVLTGLYCPGCGGLRAVHALAHGDPAAALGLNPLLVAAVPLLAALWARWAVRSWRGLPFDAGWLRPAHAWWLLGVMIVFWIGRNLPFGDFLAP